MAKQRPSVHKRQRDQIKRQREEKKAEKAALKKERRLIREQGGEDAPLGNGGVPTVEAIPLPDADQGNPQPSQ